MTLGTDFHPGDVVIDFSVNDTEVRQELLDPSNFGVPMGSYCLTSWILHMIVAIDASIFVLGIIGNAIICTVIKCSKSMHTPTNCYLFSLSMSDLLLLVTGAPHEIHEMYYPDSFYGGTVGCLLRNWVVEIAVNVSVITITTFTYERYLAICRPFALHAMSQVSRVKRLLIAIWFVAVFISLPVASQHRYVEKKNGIKICEFDQKIIPYSAEVRTMLLFVVPMTVITVMYILIGMSLLRTERKEGNGLNEAQIHGRTDESSRRTVKILVVIVLAFFLCWAPFHVQRLMAAHFDNVKNDVATSYDKLFCVVTHVSGITYLLSAVMNPLVYSIMSSKFRDAFEELLFSTSKNICQENHYGWKRSWKDTKDANISSLSGTSFTLITAYDNTNP